jgi:hypothetical protein
MDFIDKWRAIQTTHQSKLVIGLAPRLEKMPAPIARYDDPFLPFGRAVIEATADLACGYALDLASYLALGAAGAIALERTIPVIPREIPVILHGAFATPDYAKAAFDSPFAVDAVTLTEGALSVLRAYTADHRHAAFVDAKSAISPMGGNVGFYTQEHFELADLRALWITEPIIYAAGTLDFTEYIRVAADKFRIESLKADT